MTTTTRASKMTPQVREGCHWCHRCSTNVVKAFTQIAHWRGGIQGKNCTFMMVHLGTSLSLTCKRILGSHLQPILSPEPKADERNHNIGQPVDQHPA